MNTITLKIPEAQLIDWVRELSPSARQALLRAIIPSLDQFEMLVDYGGERIRQVSNQRGLDWDSLNDDERQKLVDEILHED